MSNNIKFIITTLILLLIFESTYANRGRMQGGGNHESGHGESFHGAAFHGGSSQRESFHGESLHRESFHGQSLHHESFHGESFHHVNSARLNAQHQSFHTNTAAHLQQFHSNAAALHAQILRSNYNTGWHNNWNGNWQNNWNNNHGWGWNNHGWGYWNNGWGYGWYNNWFAAAFVGVTLGAFLYNPYCGYYQPYNCYYGNYPYYYGYPYGAAPIIINDTSYTAGNPATSTNEEPQSEDTDADQVSPANETWVTAANGDVPDNAVINVVNNGNPTYYCRAKYMKKLNYGTLIPNDGCYVQDKTVSMRFVNYQVLVK